MYKLMFRRRLRLILGAMFFAFLAISAAKNMHEADSINNRAKIVNKQVLGDKKETYIVKKGDCLSIIASKYVESYEILDMVEMIKYANNIVGDGISPGQVLQIPNY